MRGQVDKIKVVKEQPCRFIITISPKILGKTIKPNGYRLTGFEDDDRKKTDSIFIWTYLPKTNNKMTVTNDNIEVMLNDLCKINEYYLISVKAVPIYTNPEQEEFTLLFTYKKKKK